MTGSGSHPASPSTTRQPALAGDGPGSRVAPTTGTTRDPKPPKRVVNPDAQPVDKSPLVTMRCPLCQRPVTMLTRHHVVGRGQGGDDVPENLIWVCGDGTTGCHGVLTHRCRDGLSGLDFADVGAALVVYVNRLPAVLAYVAAKKWTGYLEDMYVGRLAKAIG